MKGRRRAAILLVAPFLVLISAVIALAATKAIGGASPDRPPFAQEADGDYLRLRDEYIARLRGIETDRFANPLWRESAVRTRFTEEKQRDQAAPNAAPAWAVIGPDSVSNGQALDGGDTTVSGRVTAIAVDPTNSSKVYLGTAQGGVWRSLNGGTSWSPIFDAAQSLSIGALAVAPSNPSVVYVGTGEAHNSTDSFFGVGVYRIDNADTSPTLVGPINPQTTFTCNPAVCTGTFTTSTFSGRSVSRILVDPTNAATIFVSTSSGVSGMGANELSNSIPPLGVTGVYRSSNATATANAVAFQKLAVGIASSFDSPPTGNRQISDMTFVNGNPNSLLVSTFGLNAVNDGGIFRSTNALAATPTFAHTLQAQIQRIAFGVNGTTVLAATSESTASGNGRLRESTDGGATWPTVLGAADGFCDGQCFYDIAVGIDPQVAGPNFRIYLGGNARGTSSDGMKLSNNGGATFSRDDNGLHADTHAIVFDVSTNPSNVWTGNDGGVWKRSAAAAAGTLWTNLNNALTTLQFESVALGKSDPFFGIGGTQDNGTEIQQTSLGNWSQADFGDGGYALIDQSTTSTSNVTMYHTYFNQTNTLIGFGRTNLTSCGVKGGWSGRGFGFGSGGTACDGTIANLSNGISGTDAVSFYAPMALGPGTPNTLYFGTDRLYRSTDKGDTMVVVSQAPIVSGSPIAAIGISPTNDNVRIVGLRNGQVWRTTTGSSTLTNVTSASFPANPTGSATNKWVGRAVIDPNNPDTAYVTFSFYAPAGQGVWKTTNLSAATPVWSAAANGIPSVPVNAFLVDPNDSTHLFAGTDVGVFASTNGGATWAPFGTGLPAVAVFDMKIVQPGTPSEKLRVATHGRSMWEISLSSPPPQGNPVADFDGDGDTDLSVFRPSEGGWYMQGQPPFPQIWGALGDLSVPGDYDGNGTTDIAVFRNGQWNVKGQPPFPQIWGQAGDVPVPGDYDGNGTTDIAVFRNGQWFVKGQPPFPQIWGQAGDVPVPGDYDGNGTTDIAVFRNGEWYVKGQPPFPQIWGQAGDVPVPGDYDGNGTTDIAVFRSGQWFVKGQPPFPQIWGQAGDVPVPGDYDGNGSTDIAVFRNGQWSVKGQPPFPQIWGTNCDIPQPLPYAIRTLIPHGGCADG